MKTSVAVEYAYHRDHPYQFDAEGLQAFIDREPGRIGHAHVLGQLRLARPIWAPVNYLVVAQGLVMTAAVQVFFSPGWLPGHISSALGQTLITLCLLYILMRIPFWIARPVLSPFGGSPLRRAARFAVTAAVLSRIAPLLRPSSPPKGGKSGKSGPSGGKPKGSTP